MAQIRRTLSLSLLVGRRASPLFVSFGADPAAQQRMLRQITGVHAQRHVHHGMPFMRPASIWPSRAMSMDAAGESDGANAGEGEAAPKEDAAEVRPLRNKKERMQRGRRDDGPNPDFNPVPIQPILSSETKTLIYELHAKDPQENSQTALAARFGISDVRVQAILMLQKRYRERQKEGTVVARGEEMKKIVERASGAVKVGYNSPFYAPDREGFRGVKADAQERNIKARPRPLFDVVDMHKAKRAIARLDEKYSGAGSFNPKKVEHERLTAAAASEVPVSPLPQQHGVAVTMSKRFKYVFADISKGVSGEARMVIVREPDGTCRAGNFEERYRVEQFVSPPKLPPA